MATFTTSLAEYSGGRDFDAPVANLLPVPKPGTVISGWGAFSGAALSIAATSGETGGRAWQVITDGSSTTGGMGLSPDVSLVAGKTYTFVARIKGTAGAALRVLFSAPGGTALTNAQRQTTFNASGGWETITKTLIVDATGLWDTTIRTNGAIATTFHVERVMLVEGEWNGVWGDGDTPGWLWDGTPNASTSRGPQGIVNLVARPKPIDSISGMGILGTGTTLINADGAAEDGGDVWRVTTDGSSGSGGMQSNGINGSARLEAGQTYTIIARLKGQAGAILRFNITSGNSSANPSFNVSGAWETVAKTFSLATVGTALSYGTRVSGSQATTWDVAWYMVIPGEWDGVYLDGDQPGCDWLGTPYASPSIKYQAPVGRILNARRSTATTTYQDVVRDTPDLVARWLFDETTGSLIDDIGGKTAAKTGGSVILGTPPLVGSGTSITFTDPDSYLQSTLTFAGGPPTAITAMAWIRVDELSNIRGIFRLFYSTLTAGGALEVTTDGRLQSKYGNGTSDVVVRSNPGVIQVGQIYHVAVTHDGSTARVYVDGVQVAFNTTPYNPGSSSTLRIGHSTNNSPVGYFQGVIDEPAICDRALTAVEISNHYMAGVAGQTVPNPGGGDYAPASDALTRLYSGPRSISEDIISVLPAVTRTVGTNRAPVDTAGAADSAGRQTMIGRFSDSWLTAWDSPTRRYNGGRSSSESITVSDSLRRGTGWRRSTQDVQSISDALLRTYFGVRRPVDTVTGEDLLSRFYFAPRFVFDAVDSLNESIRTRLYRVIDPLGDVIESTVTEELALDTTTLIGEGQVIGSSLGDNKLVLVDDVLYVQET